MSVSDVVTYTPLAVDLRPTYQDALPVSAWMLQYVAADVPESSLPWMLAQGWQIGSINYDQKTTPPTPYYNLYRTGMYTPAVLQSLVNTYTNAYNEGRLKNSDRYEQIVTNWTYQIEQNIVTLDQMVANSNAYVSLYLGNLNTYMAQVDTTITAALTAANEGDALLDNLGTQEVIRINEQFDNLTAKTLQQFTDRGFYSSALIAQATAQIERERSMALTDLADKLARERVDQSRHYSDAQFKAAAMKMQANLQRLQGLAQTHEQEMGLYKYMIDTVNGVIIGLFGFEERRTDAYPSLETLAQLCAQLGDNSATSWVSP